MSILIQSAIKKEFAFLTDDGSEGAPLALLLVWLEPFFDRGKAGRALGVGPRSDR